MATLALSRPRRRSVSLVGMLRTAGQLRAQRKALRGLDDRMLADLGITRAQAMTEAKRPMWDMPR